MWESVQIYLTDSCFFLNNLLAVVDKKYGNFFYTVYFDAYGYHVRFRFNGNLKLWYKWLNSLSYEIHYTLYDPDIIRYGANNKIYEHFSVATCNFIVKNRMYDTLEKRISYAIAIIDFLIQQLEIKSIIYFKKHINFWQGSFDFLKGDSRLTDVKISQNANYNFSEEHRKELEQLIKGINTKNPNEICFYLIHLTLNRLSFNIKEEQKIVSYFEKYRS